jgi:hypothetical protein
MGNHKIFISYSREEILKFFSGLLNLNTHYINRKNASESIKGFEKIAVVAKLQKLTLEKIHTFKKLCAITLQKILAGIRLHISKVFATLFGKKLAANEINTPNKIASSLNEPKREPFIILQSQSDKVVNSIICNPYLDIILTKKINKSGNLISQKQDIKRKESSYFDSS